MSAYTTKVSYYFSFHISVSTSRIGFHGDVNGTYPVGKIDEDSAKLIRTSRECLDKSMEICKPGALFRDIGKIMQVDLILGLICSHLG